MRVSTKRAEVELRGGGGGDVTSLPDTWVGNHPGLPGPPSRRSMASSTRPVAGTTWLGMTSGAIHVAQVPESGWPVRFPHRSAATCQPTANGSRSGGVALFRQSRSALRRSSLGHGLGQAIGARMHGSAPWKTEETIVGLPRLLRSDSPDLVAVTFHVSRSSAQRQSAGYKNVPNELADEGRCHRFSAGKGWDQPVPRSHRWALIALLALPLVWWYDP